jgi:hypothetical protein
MKKVLFTILGFGFLALNAQQVAERINYNHQEFKGVVKGEDKKSDAKRDLSNGWYDYANAYNDFNGTGFTSSVYFMSTDTNLYTVYTDGSTGNTNWHVLGRTNDPRDIVYSNNPAKYSRHNTYTWDSIRWTQFYVRQADSMMQGGNMVEIVDTVFIQYFKPSGLEFPSYIFTSDPNMTRHYSSFPLRNSFSVKTKLNSAAFKTDTIFLTKEWADSVNLDGASTTFFGRRIVAPVGITVPHSATNQNANIVGHTFTFKPMQVSTLGDTAIAYNGSSWEKKYNMYAVRMYAKTGFVIDNIDIEAINSTIISNTQMAFGATLGIWKSYLPGNVFTASLVDGTEYHLTTQTLSADQIDANGNGIGNIYPNPSNGVREVFVPVVLTQDAQITLSIRDITGKIVRTINGDYNAGDFDIAVSTEGLSNGVYTCTLLSNKINTTTKFILN